MFYETLVQTFDFESNEYLWCDKQYIANKVNGAYSAQVGEIDSLYELNLKPTAHDACSLMNTDRLEINESLEFEMIVLVRDNMFKIATHAETIAEEERIRSAALKALWRGSMIKAKRLQDQQIIIDFENEVETVIETFGRK